MTDLILEEGDLKLNLNNSDLAVYLKEEDNITSSVARRVKTLTKQYYISYYDYINLQFNLVDQDYGSNIYSYLSYPIHLVLSRALDEIRLTLNKEPRITILNIETAQSPSGSVKFIVTYDFNNNTYSTTI